MDTTFTLSPPGLMARIARSCVRHRWIVVGVWVALVTDVDVSQERS